MNLEEFRNCEKINYNTGFCELCKEGFFLNSGDKKCLDNVSNIIALI